MSEKLFTGTGTFEVREKYISGLHPCHGYSQIYLVPRVLTVGSSQIQTDFNQCIKKSEAALRRLGHCACDVSVRITIEYGRVVVVGDVIILSEKAAPLFYCVWEIVTRQTQKAALLSRVSYAEVVFVSLWNQNRNQ